jgi:hypothetical protein
LSKFAEISVADFRQEIFASGSQSGSEAPAELNLGNKKEN